MNKFNKKHLLLAFNIILGLIIILYTFYRRILLIRLPKKLYFINYDRINYSLAFLITPSSFICIYICYQNILLLLKKESLGGLWNIIFSRLNKIIENALFEIYSFIGNLLFSDPYNTVSFWTQKFYKYFKNISETFFLFILYSIRIIILVCFLLDVFVFFKLQYVYKAYYLLCISLFIKIFFYMMRDFSGNLEELISMLIIEDKGIQLDTGFPRTSFKLKEEYKHLDLEYYVGQYILCSKISGYLDIYERYRSFFDPKFNIVIYSLYLIGWSFILYQNILIFMIT